MIRPPCPPGTKSKGTEDLPTVYPSTPEGQEWFARNHGRDVEAVRPVGDSWIGDLKRLGHGFTRQYERLPQGGRWQKVRVALDKLRTAADSAETQSLLKLRGAFNTLNKEQRSKLGGVLLARDLEEEIRIQKESLSVEEQARFDVQVARMERVDTKQRKGLEKALEREGKTLTDTRDVTAKRLRALQLRVKELESTDLSKATERASAIIEKEERVVLDRRLQRVDQETKQAIRAVQKDASDAGSELVGERQRVAVRLDKEERTLAGLQEALTDRRMERQAVNEKVQRDALTAETRNIRQQMLRAKERVKVEAAALRAIDERLHRQREAADPKLAATIERIEAQAEQSREKVRAAFDRRVTERSAGRLDTAETRRLAKQLEFSKRKVRSAEAALRQADKALVKYPETVQKRLADFDRRAEARIERASSRFRTETKLAHATGLRLPDGLTEQTVSSMMKDAETILANDPAVKAAFDARRGYMRDTVDELKRLHKELFGFEPDLNREEYVHHQVLLHALEESGKGGGGGRVRAPLNSFYLKRRKGSTLAYNTNFFEAEQRVMGRMLGDVQQLRALAAIKEHDISARVLAEGLAARRAGEKADFQSFVPEGYVRWAPDRGATVAKFWSPREFMLDRLEQAGYERLGLTNGQNKQDFYSQEMSSWVIPEELADTLDAVVAPTRNRWSDLVGRITRYPVQGFKLRALYGENVLRYIEGNLAGDTHAAFLYTSPRRWTNLARQFTMRAFPEIMGDLARKGKGKLSPEYEAFLERAGREGAQIKTELGLASPNDVKGRARILQVWLNEPTLLRQMFFGTRQALAEPFRFYLNQVMGGDAARERLWRYSLFLDYLQQMEQSPDGRPKDWGTSIPDEVLAYDNLYDRAYHLSNDTMGAYDKTTEAGRLIAGTVAPFWRYQEINHKRAYRYMINQVGSTTQAATMGNRVLHALGQGAKATPLVAARVGFFAAKVVALEAAFQAWNYTQYPDLEESLSDDQRSRPHLIFGYDERTGQAQILFKLGAIPDFYAMFGLFDNYKFGQAWLNGQMSSKDAIRKMYDKTAETFGQTIGPWKQVPQIISGIRELPGGKTAPIRDTADHAIGQFLGPTPQRLYRHLKGIPQPAYDIRKHGLAVINGNEQAYQQTMERMDDFQRRPGGGGASAPTPAQNALYWHRQARRYGDEALAKKYAFDYIKEGGDPVNGYTNVAKALSPIKNLTPLQLGKWLGTLQLREKRNVMRGMQHWGQLFAPDYDMAADIAGSLKDAPKEVRDAMGHGPRSLRRVLAQREGQDETTLKAADERLSVVLPYLAARVLGQAAIDNKVRDVLLTKPEAMNAYIEGQREKAGVSE